MALVDPTGGVGYAFGQKLPSTHMTTIATQQPNAIDGVNGGTYTCLAALTTTNNAARNATFNGTAVFTFNNGADCTVKTPTPGTGTGLSLVAFNNIEILDSTPLGNLSTAFDGEVVAKLTYVTGKYQALTTDANHTLTSFIVRSTFVPTVDRTLTLTSYPEGSVVLIRIDNTSVNKNIIIKDSLATTVATLGAGAGTDNWIQIGINDTNHGFSLAWDGGGGWTIAV